MSISLTYAPLAKNNWKDLVGLFGENGACGGCWCMFWRLPRKEYLENKGEGNREALHMLVKNGEPPGILAYHKKVAVGWCALAPRDEYVRLSKSRVLAPVDDKQVWSVVCFFIAKQYRNQGVATGLLEAATGFVRERGGEILEGYPTSGDGVKSPDAFVYTGMELMFADVGFDVAVRRSAKRPVMRFPIRASKVSNRK